MTANELKSQLVRYRTSVAALICVLIVIVFVLLVRSQTGGHIVNHDAPAVLPDLPPQTVLRVGPRTFTDADLEFILSQGRDDTPSLTLGDVINNTIDRVLLAEQARIQGLEGRADVRRRLDYLSDRVLADAMVHSHLEGRISETDLKKLYEANLALIRPQLEVRARQILVPDKATADQVIKRLEAGDSFASLAFAYSTDRVSREKGGDMGYFTRDMLNINVTRTAFTIGVGVRSEPFRSPRGWHILEVMDRRRRVEPTFQELRPDLEQFLRNSALQELITGLRETAVIVVNENAINQMVPDMTSSDSPESTADNPEDD
ncbi:MAG: peptidylprolyl isomerase [Hyphomonadaceae bacterium]|nr:peptidylprolyl isomerase [Hyphomonadaceae bacterium]